MRREAQRLRGSGARPAEERRVTRLFYQSLSKQTPTNYIIGPRGGVRRQATEGCWRRSGRREEACRLLLSPCGLKESLVIGWIGYSEGGGHYTRLKNKV